MTKRQIERIVEGLDPAKELLAEFNEARRRPGRLAAEKVRFTDVAARYLVAYKTKRDGTPRPKSSLAKERPGALAADRMGRFDAAQGDHP